MFIICLSGLILDWWYLFSERDSWLGWKCKISASATQMTSWVLSTQVVSRFHLSSRYVGHVSAPLGVIALPQHSRHVWWALFCKWPFHLRLPPRALLPSWDRYAVRASNSYHSFLSSALQLTVCPFMDLYRERWQGGMLVEQVFEQSFPRSELCDKAKCILVLVSFNKLSK